MPSPPTTISVSIGASDVGDRLVGDHRDPAARADGPARSPRPAPGTPAGPPPGWRPRTPRRARSGRGPAGQGTRRARRHAGSPLASSPGAPGSNARSPTDPASVRDGRIPDGHRTVRAEPDRGRCTSGACAPRCWPGCSPDRPGSRFLLRIEDLDPVTSSPEHEAGQLADLAALGLDWDGPVVRQSERRRRPRAALASSSTRGYLPVLLQPPRDPRGQRGAARAARHVPGHLPPPHGRRGRRRASAEGRPAALRLRGGGEPMTIVDRLRGAVTRRPTTSCCAATTACPRTTSPSSSTTTTRAWRRSCAATTSSTRPPSQAHLLDLLGRPRPDLGARPAGARSRRPAPRQAPRLGHAGRPRRRGDRCREQVRSRLAASLGLAEPGRAACRWSTSSSTRFDPSRLAPAGPGRSSDLD